MKKDLKIEKMRIIACIMVILTHVSASVYTNYKIGSFKWNIFNFYDCLSRGAVPVFVMISGILLLDNTKKLDIKKIYIKYIPKMLIILALGSLLYSLWYCFGIHIISYSIKNIIKAAISGPGHLWYLSVIIFLYAITPFFRKITQNNDEITVKYCFWLFLISSFFITFMSFSFMPYYSHIKTIINKIYFDKILMWNSYFLLGYYIYKTDYLDKYKNLAYILGFIGLLSQILLTLYISNKSGINNFDFYNNMGFPVFAPSIALLFWMKSFKPKECHRRIIETFSNTTLGIYLIHVIFIDCITYIIKYDLANSFTIVTIPITTIIVFLISFILVYFYKTIMGFTRHKSTFMF